MDIRLEVGTVFKWILEFILIDSPQIGGILKNFGLTASFCRMINFICLCVFHIFAKFSQNFRIQANFDMSNLLISKTPLVSK